MAATQGGAVGVIIAGVLLDNGGDRGGIPVAMAGGGALFVGRSLDIVFAAISADETAEQNSAQLVVLPMTASDGRLAGAVIGASF